MLRNAQRFAILMIKSFKHKGLENFFRKMYMFNPPHPGEFIQATYLEPLGLSCRALAENLSVSPSTLNRILKKRSGVSPEMALRLSKALGRSPESWLAMQDSHDLWQARKQVNLSEVRKVQGLRAVL